MPDPLTLGYMNVPGEIATAYKRYDGGSDLGDWDLRSRVRKLTRKLVRRTSIDPSLRYDMLVLRDTFA
jgi:hypothetical protein